MKLTPGLLTNSWELKLTALGLAVLLWAAVQSEEMTRFTMRDVPIELRMTEQAWVAVGAPDPATVTVGFVGPVRELLRLAFAEATLVIPVEEVEDTLELYRPRSEWLETDRRFDNLRVEEVRPAVVQQRFQPIETRMVPVAVRPAAIPPWVRLTRRPEAEPALVTIEGRRDLVQRVDSVVANLIDLDAALRSGGSRVVIDTAGLGVSVRPIEVVVRMRAVPSDSTPRADASGGAGWP